MGGPLMFYKLSRSLSRLNDGNYSDFELMHEAAQKALFCISDDLMCII